MSTQGILERVAPLTSSEYAKTFATFIDRSTECDAMVKIAGTVIKRNKMNKTPTRILSIGAGRGHFEVRLVQEVGLNLAYVYAVEPTPGHREPLKSAMNSIGAEYHIDTSYFDQHFQLDTEKGVPHAKFDLVLMSHCLYVFDDPCAMILHASTFLKPGGTMLLFNQSDRIASVDIYNEVIRRSDHQIFSSKKTIQNHLLVPDHIVRGLRELHPSLKVETIEEPSHLEVDDFVRKIENSETDDVVSFLLQCPYKKLSEETRDIIYRKVKDDSDLLEGKYWLRHPNTGIVIRTAC